MLKFETLSALRGLIFFYAGVFLKKYIYIPALCVKFEIWLLRPDLGGML